MSFQTIIRSVYVNYLHSHFSAFAHIWATLPSSMIDWDYALANIDYLYGWFDREPQGVLRAFVSTTLTLEELCLMAQCHPSVLWEELPTLWHCSRAYFWGVPHEYDDWEGIPYQQTARRFA